MQPEMGSGGCRYAPLMRRAGEWWRWLSSLLVQDSFPHLLASALLYGALSLHVELRFGTRRTLLLTLLAALAGNFLDTLITVRWPQLNLLFTFPVAGSCTRRGCLSHAKDSRIFQM